MVLKITSSAVQTSFSRLDQSQSWIFMKCAEIKITAYWGWTPPQKSDRMGIDNQFWPRSKKKVFKTGSRTTAASAVILTLGQKSAVTAQCGVEFQKKILISRCPGTCLVNDNKNIFLIPCTQWAPQWRKAKNSYLRSDQVKRYNAPAQQ